MGKRQNYEADGGFVEDAPQEKKRKSVGEKSAKPEVSGGKHTDDDGNPYWNITHSRRVTISEFKHATMVSIREFYEKDGKSLPGKKGISLTVDQFAAVIDILPGIEDVLNRQGFEMPRPVYAEEDKTSASASSKAKSEEAEEEEEEEAEDSEDEEPVPRKKIKTNNEKPKKKNHEATDDEESD